MNYFKYHKASHKILINKSKRKILENADAWDDEQLKVERYELTNDDKFIKEKQSASWIFSSGGKLYYFFTGQTIFVNNKFISPIESFFELNTSKKRCLSGQYGVFFKFKKIL